MSHSDITKRTGTTKNCYLSRVQINVSFLVLRYHHKREFFQFLFAQSLGVFGGLTSFSRSWFGSLQLVWELLNFFVLIIHDRHVNKDKRRRIKPR